MKLAEQIAAQKRAIQELETVRGLSAVWDDAHDLNLAGLRAVLATIEAAGKWAEECEEIGLLGPLAPAFARGRPAVTALYRAVRGED